MVAFSSRICILSSICFTVVQDKSAEVRKAAECCIGEVLRVCGQEAVWEFSNAQLFIHFRNMMIWINNTYFSFVLIVQATKSLKDLKGSALALVLERIKPSAMIEGILLQVLSYKLTVDIS